MAPIRGASSMRIPQENKAEEGCIEAVPKQRKGAERQSLSRGREQGGSP